MESIISKRIPYSKIRVVMETAQALEAEGKEIIHMEIGRPDFCTPKNIIDAAVEALQAGKVHYCANAGILELREAISNRYQKKYGATYNPKKQVLVTNGAAEGIYLSVCALLNPGDQVLVPDPAWINYRVVPVTALVEPVLYSLSAENEFLPDLEEIEAKITDRTKMIMITNPSNPTGRVIPKDLLRKMADLAVKHDLIIVADEIYEDIVYAPAEFVSMSTFEDIKDRLITVSGFSKSYSMTGWRLGYVVGPDEMVNAMLRLHQYMLTSVSTFAQWGAVEALNGTTEYVDAMLKEFANRKKFIYNAISETDGLGCVEPEGAFYLFVSVRELGMDGFTAADVLLREYGVATVPGESFGDAGKGYIRLSYACSMEDLEKAAAKFKAFAAKYKQ